MDGGDGEVGREEGGRLAREGGGEGRGRERGDGGEKGNGARLKRTH